MTLLVAFLVTCYGLSTDLAWELMEAKGVNSVSIEYEDEFLPSDECIEWRWELEVPEEIIHG